MFYSEFADNLPCPYCGKNCSAAAQWPKRGDLVPFFDQTAEDTKEQPGAFNIKVYCPHCSKDWFVVWDEDPR